MKLKLLFLLVFCLPVLPLAAQRPTPDIIETKHGNLTIQPITHGTLVLTWNGKTIYVDPYGGAPAFTGIPPADLVLITDIHKDHLDLETLRALPASKAVFVVPQAVADELPETYKDQLVVLKNGKSTEQLDIGISAVPMYNLPETEDSRHPKGRGNGYVLEMGGKKIYLSGDTEDTEEMRALQGIDVAFVCMNLPFTMTVQQAAEGVLAFKPKIVYPYHYRGQEGQSDVNEFKKLVTAGNKNIEVRLRNWYPGQ
ncbi:MBL fold metallo-hydrolase [Adhaeribacter sp. BT258]|uniref:MBL fold metallo-hydrolase n=1 Tax=Adhaeribacter terrigena TaxID=2793070 RepID=A0ABS1C244_9BACT|nr:MBL fold metallo-hydrolase [Adhaeribacter terrigena]MBK0403457.1 MBL fold metallo-hydrolase [Adhaeribacter terrigena]